MTEIERRTGRREAELRASYLLEPMSWRDVKKAVSEQYFMEMRIETGRRMAMRSMAAIDDLQFEMDTRPHPLKNLIMQSFAFGAAELINDYMTER